MQKKQSNGQVIILGLFIVFLIIWAFFVSDIREREDMAKQDDYIVNFKNESY